ncbi:MAG: M48 family peptidase, partial [Proteobacteria bacterium]
MSKSFLQRLPIFIVTTMMTLGLTQALAANDNLKIPNLGASSTSLYSEEYERKLGNLWLKVFRAQAPILDDPLLYDYIENLIFQLVLH